MLDSRKLMTIPVAAALLVAMAGCSQNNSMPKPSANRTSSSTPAATPAVAGTAAVVGDASISEQQVADYISQYRIYTNRVSDTDWATFLDESNTTAEQIRDAAIQHFAENIAVEKKAAELGIEATDSELDEVIKEARELSGATSDSGNWKSLLETSGYDEESYRNDMRLNVLRSKLVAQEAGLQEATEPEMLSLAKNSPASYTGKKYTDLSYPASGSYAASAFATANQGKSYGDFQTAAQSEVDSGAARAVSEDRWSCLVKLSGAASSTLDELKVGDMGRYVEDDGSVHVIFVTEEYITQANGSFLLNEMPEAIKARLRSDASALARANATTAYLTKLVSDMGIDKKSMPTGLPYDVSLDKSEYGNQKTQAEQDAEAQALVDNQLDALENINSGDTEAYNNLQNIISDSQAKKDSSNGNE